MIETHTSLTQFVAKYYKLLLVIILAWTFFTRVWRLDQPKTYVFDEVYHAVTAKLIARNDDRAFEWWNPDPEPGTAVDWLHPPLAKHTQAASMLLLGENSLGWRFSSVVFGVLVVLITAKLAEELFSSKSVSLLSAWLVSLDGLILTQSRIAMNDIHVTFFILLTIYVYLRHLRYRGVTSKYLWLTGLAAGLAMASKWSGLFALLVVLMFEGIYTLQGLTKSFSKNFKQLVGIKGIELVLALVIIPVVVYVSSYTPMFLQGKSLFCTENKEIRGTCYLESFYWSGADKENPSAKPLYTGYVSHFIELHRQIWWYQTTLTATHPFQSRPWQWFLNARPVWFTVDYGETERADIYNVGNSALFWAGDIALVFTLILLIKYMCRNTDRPQMIDQTAIMTRLSLLVTSYFMVWLPWQFSPRIMFFYHYAPAVPLLTILLSYWLVRAWRKGKALRGLSGLTIAMIFIIFCVWYPHWTNMKVATSVKERVYFLVEGWR